MKQKKHLQGHGYFRKSKAYGLISGLALSAVAVTTTAVSADETTATIDTQPDVSVVSESNATNLSDTQTDNTEVHDALASQSGTQTGDLTNTVTSDTLNQSVSDAKEAGVEVSTGDTVTHDSLADAQADLNSQEQAVETATEAQKAVDEATAKATEAAQQSGVDVTTSNSKTYTSTAEAQADAKAQTNNLTEVTNAQKQVNNQLPKAIESATQSGVKVTVKAGAKTSDAKKALDELSKQVASLKQAKDTQTAITESMAQALNEAKKIGVTVNTANVKTYDDLAQALADAQAQVAKLTEFKETQASVDEAVKQSVDNAKISGVTVSTGETKTYTSVEEAKADSAKQTSSLDNAAETQKEADQVISDLTKQAQDAGLDLTKGASKSYTSVEEAKQDLAKQEEAFSKAQAAKTGAENQNQANAKAAKETQDKANQAIQDAINKATAVGVKVKLGELVEATIPSASDIVKKVETKLNEGIKKYQDYLADMAEYEAHRTEDGYLSEPSAQSLIFKSEPNAQHTVSKAQATGDELARVEAGMRQETIDAMNNSTSKQYIIATGESISVTYTNLENSSLDGTKIAKVVYTYTLNHSDYGNEVVLGFNDDPTATLWYLNGDKDFNLNMDVKFYDGDGKLIDPTGSLVSFASLNTGGVNGDWEGVSDFSGDFISINGSSIAVQSDGVARSNGSNSYKSLGSQYDAGEWDVDGSPLEYYGAIVGKAKGSINFNIRSNGRGYVWFAFNSNVKAHGIPKFPQPVEVQKIHITPEVVSIPKDVSLHDVKLQAETHAIKLETAVAPITVETEVTTPALSATVHDITLKTAVHPVKVTQKPTNEKAVTNNDNVDINGKTVAKGSTVKWVLKNGNLLAGREELTAVVMNDPFPAGFEVDSEATAKANADYYTLKTTENGYQLVGTAKLLSLLNAHRDQDVEVPGFVFVGKPLNDNAHYDNAFETIYSTANGYYKVVSNIPSIDTPDNPKPTKTVTDKAGSDIDGKTVFDKDVTFHLVTDYSTYVNTVVDVNTTTKAAGIYDDTDDATVKPDVAKATVTDSQGNDITATGTFYDIEAGQPIPQELQIFLDGAHLTPDGEFVVWIPNDLKDYYQNYVLTSNNVTVNLPVEVIAKAGETAENTFVQVEFGNGYQSNLVFVKVPDVSPEKHAIDKNGTVLDGQTVNLHQVFNYLLDGVTIPKDHDTLWQYDGKDKLDIEHDRYTGNWKGVITGTEYTAKEDMTLPYDVITEDGTVLKAGDTITAGTSYHFIFEFDQDTNDDFINQIVKVTWDVQKGEWTYSIDKDFLNSLGVEGTFDADFWLEVERIKDGEVENTFINTINGRELIAKVTTYTDPEPEEPAPATPQPPQEVPTVQASALPMTGESTSPLSILASLAGLAMMALGVFGIRRKEKEGN